MKKLFFIYRTARNKNMQNVKKGLEPDHILYGYNHLKKMGHQVGFSDIAYKPFNFLFWAWLPFQKLIIRCTLVGFKLDQALLLIPEMKKHHIVITTADSAGLPVLLLKKIKLITSRIVYISTGLINELDIRQSSFFYNLYKKLFQNVDVIIVHSQVEKMLFLKNYPFLKNKIEFIPFGIDIDFFKGKYEAKEYILSIGHDKSRDWRFLAEVAKRIPYLQFIVVTYKDNVKNINFPRNVSLKYNIPYSEAKKLYLESKLVLLPLQETNRASGQISFLEAIACRKKVVVANIKGIKETYSKLINSNSNIFLYETGNINDCLEAIRNSSPKKVNYGFKIGNLSSKNYAKAIAKIIKIHEK